MRAVVTAIAISAGLALSLFAGGGTAAVISPMMTTMQPAYAQDTTKQYCYDYQNPGGYGSQCYDTKEFCEEKRQSALGGDINKPISNCKSTETSTSTSEPTTKYCFDYTDTAGGGGTECFATKQGCEDRHETYQLHPFREPASKCKKVEVS